MASSATFTPSAAASGTVTVPRDTLPATFALPTVDAANVDMTLRINGGTPAWLAFGAGAVVGPAASGCIPLPAAGTVLLTEVATAQAAAAFDSLVRSAQGGIYGAAGVFSVVAQARGGTVTLTRGTATPAQSF